MNATTMARQVRTNDLSHKGRPGELVYSDCDPLPSGRNIAKSTPQKSSITFAGAGTLLPNAEVVVNLIIDCVDNPITLSNFTNAAKPLQALLIAEINGDSAAGIPGRLPGMTATAVGTAIVEITGQSGKKFAISYSGFAVTVGGVARPAVPTTTLIESAYCSGLLPFGYVVIKAKSASTRQAPNGLVKGESAIASLPTGNINSEPLGIVIREMAEKFDPFGNLDNCCDTTCEEEGIGCNECYHLLELCCTKQQAWIPIEAFPAGTTVPADLEETEVEIHYRNAVSGSNTKLGIPALKLSAAADPTLKPLSNKAFHAVLVELGGTYKGYQMARIKITPISN
jgi:hypothetical protein